MKGVSGCGPLSDFGVPSPPLPDRRTECLFRGATVM